MSISKDVIKQCLLITYDEEGTEKGIPVVPIWKWLMEVSEDVRMKAGA